MRWIRTCVAIGAVTACSFQLSGSTPDTTVTTPRYKVQFGFQLEKSVKSGDDKTPDDYNYKPVLLQFEIQKPLSSSRNSTWYLDYFVQPQFNIVRFQDRLLTSNDRSHTHSWETGVNLGLVFYKSLYTVASQNKAAVYVMAGTGPHFVSSTPQRQSEGFIFSDNIRFGLRIPVSQNTSLDLRGGLRHISNFHLKLPNSGIDNTFLGIGIRYFKR
ncbi:MAG TPA: acyloxyacyl hydrolase [Sphingobacteriaceae bacterium]